jgi:hypothetical protein
MGLENRRFDRASAPFEMECRMADMPGALWERALVRDVSAGGVAFTCDGRFGRDERLEVRINIPHTGEFLVVRGQIVRVDSPATGTSEYGVAFEDPTPDQQAKLDDLVQFLRKKPGTA